MNSTVVQAETALTPTAVESGFLSKWFVFGVSFKSDIFMGSGIQFNSQVLL